MGLTVKYPGYFYNSSYSSPNILSVKGTPPNLSKCLLSIGAAPDILESFKELVINSGEKIKTSLLHQVLLVVLCQKIMVLMFDFSPRQIWRQSRYSRASVAKQISFGAPTTDFESIWSSRCCEIYMLGVHHACLILGIQSKHNCKRSTDIHKIKLKQITSRDRVQNSSSFSVPN